MATLEEIENMQQQAVADSNELNDKMWGIGEAVKSLIQNSIYDESGYADEDIRHWVTSQPVSVRHFIIASLSDPIDEETTSVFTPAFFARFRLIASKQGD